MRFLWIVFTLTTTAAHALDYSDHARVCQAIEDNRTHWLEGGKEKFRINCPCHLTEYEKTLEPHKYKAAVDWLIDASAFARNMPEGIKPMEFMGEMMSHGVTVTKTCGPL